MRTHVPLLITNLILFANVCHEFVFDGLLGHSAVLFNIPPKPEACLEW